MNIVPLSQNDPRWSRVTIGHTKLTIGRYGCTLTALTMLLNYFRSSNLTPIEVNDALTQAGGFDSLGRLLWSVVSKVYPEVKFTKRARNYNNWEVSLYVYAKRLPVMVEVYFPATREPHWVLFIGFRRMIDPIDGTIKKTSTYSPTGYSLFDRP